MKAANEKKRGLQMVLWVAVLCSALAVVYSKHLNRQLFIEFEWARKERDALQVEWGQLLLEQSTWSSHARIESIARDRLHMALPAKDKVMMVVL